MGFLADAMQPLLRETTVAAVSDRQVVIRQELDLAVQVDRLLIFAFHQRIREIVHSAVLVMEDMFLSVVLDIDVHVLFGVDVDLFLIILVFDLEFVGPVRLLETGEGVDPKGGIGWRREAETGPAGRAELV